MVCLALVTVPRLCFALGKQQTTNRPFSPFFEVVRFRWVLGGDLQPSGVTLVYNAEYNKCAC